MLTHHLCVGASPSLIYQGISSLVGCLATYYLGLLPTPNEDLEKVGEEASFCWERKCQTICIPEHLSYITTGGQQRQVIALSCECFTLRLGMKGLFPPSPESKYSTGSLFPPPLDDGHLLHQGENCMVPFY